MFRFPATVAAAALVLIVLSMAADKAFFARVPSGTALDLAVRPVQCGPVPAGQQRLRRADAAPAGTAPAEAYPAPAAAVPAAGITVKPTGNIKAGPAKVLSSLPVKARAVFITIDDGWYPSWHVLRLMKKYHLPVTAFLIEQAAREHPDYWRNFLAAGGDIEDHTLSHLPLSRLSPAGMKTQIAAPLEYYRRLGARPFLLRPPYGAYDARVCQTAAACGIDDVIMWDAEVSNRYGLSVDSDHLQPGDIILLHWTPWLDGQLDELLDILRQNRFGVADLAAAINDPEHPRVSWLDESPAGE
ncbi:hypothetical protein A6M21_04090 [Desulfotomaculum copahuensis]|uniref:NodB homology domain-containing protein n=1 Tax=Desulfotomaculum copahuensis TaxID=1838280 RepID=A0A1B7LI59_9FIRM|nr:hypothetical protein A6M21_04090 [Desulfotomaculum copahuensis]